MPGLAFLDVVIGLVIIYLLLSVVCSAINEWIAGVLKWRGNNLWEGIKVLLNDTDGTGTAKEVYGHLFIKSLHKEERKPSYIPSRAFASALIDTIQPGMDPSEAGAINNFKITVSKIENEPLKQVLLVLINNAGNNIEKARENIEGWFDDSMDRVSGWYARKAQFSLILIALGVTILSNADTLKLAQSLWQDETLRASIVALAEKSGEACKEEDDSGECIELASQKLIKDNLPELPFGWTDSPKKAGEWIKKIIGLLITAVAVSLGAPFWFDIINKLIKIRAAGVKPKIPSLKKSESGA